MLSNFKKWVQTTVDTTLSEFPINDLINETNGVLVNGTKNAQTPVSFQKSTPLLSKNNNNNIDRPKQNGHLPLNRKQTMSSPIYFEQANSKNILDSFNHLSKEEQAQIRSVLERAQADENNISMSQRKTSNNLKLNGKTFRSSSIRIEINNNNNYNNNYENEFKSNNNNTYERIDNSKMINLKANELESNFAINHHHQINKTNHETSNYEIIENNMKLIKQNNNIKKTSNISNNSKTTTAYHQNDIICQLCKFNHIQNSIENTNNISNLSNSNKNNNNNNNNLNKCSKCDIYICDKCSILSSMIISKNESKICILCKICSKEDMLNSDYVNTNNNTTNKTDNMNNNDISINSSNLNETNLINNNLAEICLYSTSSNSNLKKEKDFFMNLEIDLNPKLESKKKRKLPLAPMEASNFSSTPALNNQTNTSILSSLSILNHNLNDLTLAKPPIISNTPASPTIIKPKLENATEWLNKSFDRSQQAQTTGSITLLGTSVSSATKSKSTQELFAPTRQYRSSSDAYLITMDEPLVEINLNRNFYLKKQQQSLESSSENVSSGKKFINQSNSNLESVKSAKPVETIEKIYLFNEPQNSIDNKSCDEIEEEVFINPSRRQSASLGINITGCQRIPELNENTLAAVVASIEPNGIVEKFNVPISEGDEIVEINGENLRNKNDKQIEKIYSSSCLSNSGEIELKVRRRSFKNSNRFAINRSLTLDKKESVQMSEDVSISSSELRDQVINELSSISSSQTESSDMISLPSLKSTRRNSNKQLQKQFSTSSFNSNTSVPHYPDVRLVDMKTNSNSSTSTSSSNPMPIYARHSNDTDTDSLAEGRGFRELSIKRKNASSQMNKITVINSSSKHKQVTQLQSLPSPNQNEIDKVQSAVKDNINKVLNSTSLITPPTPPTPLTNFQPFNSYYLNINNSPKQKLSLIEESSQSLRQSSQDSTKSVTRTNSNFLTSMDSKNLPNSRSISPINLAQFRSSSPYVVNSNKLDVDDSQSDLSNLNDTEISNYEANIMPKTSVYLNNSLTNAINRSKSPIPTLTPIQSKSSFKSKHNEPVESGSTAGPLGDIEVQMSHNEDEQQLVVKILRAKCLIAKDANGFSDPFVKICLLPGRDHENKRRTKHIMKTLNPEWNTTVYYPNIHKEEVQYKTLEFSVWDWDRFSANDFIGMVRIDLSDKKFLGDKPRWFQLKKHSAYKEHDDLNDSDSAKSGSNNKHKRSVKKK